MKSLTINKSKTKKILFYNFFLIILYNKIIREASLRGPDLLIKCLIRRFRMKTKMRRTHEALNLKRLTHIFSLSPAESFTPNVVEKLLGQKDKLEIEIEELSCASVEFLWSRAFEAFEKVPISRSQEKNLVKNYWIYGMIWCSFTTTATPKAAATKKAQCRAGRSSCSWRRLWYCSGEDPPELDSRMSLRGRINTREDQDQDHRSDGSTRSNEKSCGRGD